MSDNDKILPTNFENIMNRIYMYKNRYKKSEKQNQLKLFLKLERK